MIKYKQRKKQSGVRGGLNYMASIQELKNIYGAHRKAIREAPAKITPSLPVGEKKI